MSEFEIARRKYRPESVRVALVAESPPQEGSGRFFYFEDVAVGDSLFIELMKALYEDARGNTKSVRQRKAEFLKRFRDDGFYLIDASQKSIAGESRSVKEKAIRSGLAQLERDLTEIYHEDMRVVLISSLVYEVCGEPLRRAGFSVVNTEMIDFPSFGRQKEFQAKIRPVLSLL